MEQFLDKFIDTITDFSHIQYVVIILVLVVVSIVLRIYINATYSRYDNRHSGNKATGEEVAVAVLEAAGLHDVEVVRSERRNSDAYLAGSKTIRLSSDNFSGLSILAMSTAAHEAGHAILHSRSRLVSGISRVLDPVFDFCSNFAFLVVIVGLAISALADTPYGYYAAIAGLFMFLFAIVYGIIWFPLEIKANRLGYKALCDSGCATSMDLVDVKKVLRAASFQSFAALAAAVLSLLRVLAIIAKAKRK